VVLTATANAGSTVSWVNCIANGGAVGGTSTTATCTFTNLQASVSARVTFAAGEFGVTANAGGTGAGSVSSSPAGISYLYNAASTGTAYFDLGATVVLTAAASAGSTASWSDCVAHGGSLGGSATFATCTFANLQSAKSATATFTLNQYTVTANATGTGTGSIGSNPAGISYAYGGGITTGNASFGAGATVVLTATADAGSTVSWNDCVANGGTAGGTATAATCTFTGLSSARSATATFTEYMVKMVNDGNPADIHYNNTINGVYGMNGAATSVSIFARDTLPMATVLMDQNIAARLVGGFALHFVDNPTAYTTIGSLTIDAGTVTIDRIIIR